MKRIWGVKCLDCQRRIFSFSRHDFKFCGCKNETFVDGGREYLRYGWKTKKPRTIYWTIKLDGVYPSYEDNSKWPY